MSEETPKPLPKWVTLIVCGLGAYTVLVFIGALILQSDTGRSVLGSMVEFIDPSGRLFGGSALSAFGAIFALLGVFGTDFRWDDGGGDDGEGTPMSAGVGNALFLIIGLVFVILGVVVMCSNAPR